MAKVKFIEEKCKGCKLCINACPKAVITIDKKRFNIKGFHPAVVKEMDKCIGCGFCATMCPDAVIEIEK